MKIEHIAIWSQDLERMRKFYMTFFNITSSDKYYNPTKNFSSYFLSFENGTRIELMHQPGVQIFNEHTDHKVGFAHLAISTGSEEKVDALTEEVRVAGHVIIGEPRRTGDGYYESIISDPEGNWIEITV